VVGALVAVNAVAFGLLAVSLAGDDPPTVTTADRYQEYFEAQDTREDVHAEPTVPSVLDDAPTPDPGPPLYTAPITRLRIDTIGVDAEIITLGLRPDGVMDSPDAPEPVGWYDFTSKPGLGGNAVLSGHIDFINYGPAVFFDLDKLVDGDVLEVDLEDGTVISYAVVASQSYPVDEVPMEDVLAQTSVDTLTLITCTGAFSNGSYSHRLVVRATMTSVQVPGTPGT
jgi:LPXTG-site transpeptidase (sortase) family protein